VKRPIPNRPILQRPILKRPILNRRTMKQLAMNHLAMNHLAAKPLAVLATLVLLTACAVRPEAARDTDTTHVAASSLDTLPNAAVCQVGPDGGPVVRDAGLRDVNPNVSNAKAAKANATGTDPTQPASDRTGLADRGIGGTGLPQGTQVGDRGIGGTGIGGTGIGGTGIVGVVTGFASICVNGLEVAYDSSAPVDIDGAAGTTAALRVGQIVVIQASDSAALPVAQAISVRRQVIGRIESIELGTGSLTIARQPVSVTPETWGADTVHLGDWVAVSGLRRADGMLVASRLDLVPAGISAVRGEIVHDADSTRIGQLVLNGSAAAEMQTGQYVMVSGQYNAGQLQIRSVTPDPLFSNPAGYFGAAVSHLVLQAYVRIANGAVYLNGLKVAISPGVRGKTGEDNVAIVSLERKRDGNFTVVGLRYIDHAGPSPGAFRAPNSNARTTSVQPMQVWRSGTAMASLTGNGGGALFFSRPMVVDTGTINSPLDSYSPAGSTDGTSGAGLSTATAPLAYVTTPTLTTPTLTTPGIITSGKAMPVVTTTATAIPPATTTTAPPGTGARIDSIPTASVTSQFMSSNTTSGTAMIVPPRAAGPSGAAAIAWHPAIPGSSTSSSAVSFATQTITTPGNAAGPPSVTPTTVMPPAGGNSAGSKPAGSVIRNAADAGSAVRGH
jgi:hypothetical protein